MFSGSIQSFNNTTDSEAWRLGYLSSSRHKWMRIMIFQNSFSDVWTGMPKFEMKNPVNTSICKHCQKFSLLLHISYWIEVCTNLYHNGFISTEVNLTLAFVMYIAQHLVIMVLCFESASNDFVFLGFVVIYFSEMVMQTCKWSAVNNVHKVYKAPRNHRSIVIFWNAINSLSHVKEFSSVVSIQATFRHRLFSNAWINLCHKLY